MSNFGSPFELDLELNLVVVDLLRIGLDLGK